MTQKIHYGTVSVWFEEKQAGYVQPVKGKEATLSPQNILLTAVNLAAHYSSPQAGDEVAFEVVTGEHNLPYARNVELASTVLTEGKTVHVRLIEWDIQQNGGFGVMIGRENIHVFTLGQFLQDFTVPEIGDILSGRLLKHANGQWMLQEIQIEPPPEEPKLVKTKPEKEQRSLVSQAEVTAEPAFERGGIGSVQTTRESVQPSMTPPEQEARLHGFEPVGAEVMEEALLREITQEISSSLDAEFDAAFSTDSQEQELSSLSLNPETPVTLRGRITQWNEEKGYGFIQNSQDEQSIFFHISAYHYRRHRPKVGELVSFYCEPASPGAKPKAARVVRTEDELSLLLDDGLCDKRSIKLTSSKLPLYGVVALVYFVGVGFLSIKLMLIAALLSVVAFFVYRYDKNIAIANRNHTGSGYQSRISEDTLHFLGLAGGWPGALMARAYFNHKTTKMSFVRIFWVMVAVNLIIIYVFLVHYSANPIAAFFRN